MNNQNINVHLPPVHLSHIHHHHHHHHYHLHPRILMLITFSRQCFPSLLTILLLIPLLISCWQLWLQAQKIHFAHYYAHGMSERFAVSLCFDLNTIGNQCILRLNVNNRSSFNLASLPSYSPFMMKIIKKSSAIGASRCHSSRKCLWKSTSALAKKYSLSKLKVWNLHNLYHRNPYLLPPVVLNCGLRAKERNANHTQCTAQRIFQKYSPSTVLRACMECDPSRYFSVHMRIRSIGNGRSSSSFSSSSSSLSSSSSSSKSGSMFELPESESHQQQQQQQQQQQEHIQPSQLKQSETFKLTAHQKDRFLAFGRYCVRYQLDDDLFKSFRLQLTADPKNWYTGPLWIYLHQKEQFPHHRLAQRVHKFSMLKQKLQSALWVDVTQIRLSPQSNGCMYRPVNWTMAHCYQDCMHKIGTNTYTDLFYRTDNEIFVDNQAKGDQLLYVGKRNLSQMESMSRKMRKSDIELSKQDAFWISSRKRNKGPNFRQRFLNQHRNKCRINCSRRSCRRLQFHRTNYEQHPVDSGRYLNMRLYLRLKVKYMGEHVQRSHLLLCGQLICLVWAMYGPWSMMKINCIHRQASTLNQSYRHRLFNHDHNQHRIRQVYTLAIHVGSLIKRFGFATYRKCCKHFQNLRRRRPSIISRLNVIWNINNNSNNNNLQTSSPISSSSSSSSSSFSTQTTTTTTIFFRNIVRIRFLCRIRGRPWLRYWICHHAFDWSVRIIFAFVYFFWFWKESNQTFHCPLRESTGVQYADRFSLSICFNMQEMLHPDLRSLCNTSHAYMQQCELFRSSLENHFLLRGNGNKTIEPKNLIAGINGLPVPNVNYSFKKEDDWLIGQQTNWWTDPFLVHQQLNWNNFNRDSQLFWINFNFRKLACVRMDVSLPDKLDKPSLHLHRMVTEGLTVWTIRPIQSYFVTSYAEYPDFDSENQMSTQDGIMLRTYIYMVSAHDVCTYYDLPPTKLRHSTFRSVDFVCRSAYECLNVCIVDMAVQQLGALPNCASIDARISHGMPDFSYPWIDCKTHKMYSIQDTCNQLYSTFSCRSEFFGAKSLINSDVNRFSPRFMVTIPWPMMTKVMQAQCWASWHLIALHLVIVASACSGCSPLSFWSYFVSMLAFVLNVNCHNSNEVVDNRQLSSVGRSAMLENVIKRTKGAHDGENKCEQTTTSSTKPITSSSSSSNSYVFYIRRKSSVNTFNGKVEIAQNFDQSEIDRSAHHENNSNKTMMQPKLFRQRVRSSTLKTTSRTAMRVQFIQGVRCHTFEATLATSTLPTTIEEPLMDQIQSNRPSIKVESSNQVLTQHSSSQSIPSTKIDFNSMPSMDTFSRLIMIIKVRIISCLQWIGYLIIFRLCFEHWRLIELHEHQLLARDFVQYPIEQMLPLPALSICAFVPYDHQMVAFETPMNAQLRSEHGFQVLQRLLMDILLPVGEGGETLRLRSHHLKQLFQNRHLGPIKVRRMWLHDCQACYEFQFLYNHTSVWLFQQQARPVRIRMRSSFQHGLSFMLHAPGQWPLSIQRFSHGLLKYSFYVLQDLTHLGNNPLPSLKQMTKQVDSVCWKATAYPTPMQQMQLVYMQEGSPLHSSLLNQHAIYNQSINNRTNRSNFVTTFLPIPEQLFHLPINNSLYVFLRSNLMKRLSQMAHLQPNRLCPMYFDASEDREQNHHHHHHHRRRSMDAQHVWQMDVQLKVNGWVIASVAVRPHWSDRLSVALGVCSFWLQLHPFLCLQRTMDLWWRMKSRRVNT